MDPNSRYSNVNTYTRYQFIRNIAKLQLVPFLIFVWILTSLRFLNFQKYIVTVSYILPNFRTSFAFFYRLINERVCYIKKSLITYENHGIIPKLMHFIWEKIYYLCLLTKIFIHRFFRPKKSTSWRFLIFKTSTSRFL